MASRELSILINARNLASRVLGQVKGDINGLSGAASRASSNIGRNLAIGGAAVAAGIGLQVKAGIDSLVELERVENLTAAALASTGNVANQSAAGIRARAEALEGLTGVDDKAIQNAENLLLTFTKVGEEAFEPTIEAALNLNAVLGGGDEGLQGVLIQVAKAMNDPLKGLGALQRSGVSFTAAQVKQIKALAASNDLMGAQGIILGELETQFGDAAEKANQGGLRAQRRWSDAVEDIQKSLATGFLPLIERVSTKMTDLIADPAFLPAVQEFGEGLASAFDKGLDALEDVPWGSIGSALQIGGTGARAIMDAFLSAPGWLQTAILTGWGLNKLTGGVAGSLIGELGKGLIKGVLGIQAGVVNVSGAVVNAPGGGPNVPAPAGKFPLVPVLGALALPLALGGSQALTETGGSVEMENKRLQLTKQLNEGLITAAEAGRQWADAYGKTVANPFVRSEPIRPTSGERLPGPGPRDTASRNAVLAASISADQAMLSTARAQTALLSQIAAKRTVFNPNINVTANVNNTVNLSTGQVLQRINSYRTSINSGGFI